MSERPPILRVTDLHAGYGEVKIIHGVDLTVRRGEIIAIIGPNGAGKSTLMKAVYGVLRPSAGGVWFCGEAGREREVTGMKPNRLTALGMAYVPQLRNVFPNLTVRENLEIGGYLQRGQMPARLQTVFELFPILRDRLGQRAGTMSGGQRQMLAFGRALMTAPSLLLLDEPSAGLAPEAIDTMVEKLEAINAGGVSILMVEQNARRALAMATRGYVLDRGRNSLEGTGAALLEDPTVAQLYLGGVVDPGAEPSPTRPSP